MTQVPLLRALVTGTPPYRATQAQLQQAAEQVFPRLAARPRLQEVFRNARIDERALSLSLIHI